MSALSPEDVDGVAEAVRAHRGRLRVRCGGSRQDTLPPAADAATLSLAALDRIVRLDAGDQTCTVEPGVARAALDAALAEHGLELPCLGDGTIGGLFACDPHGPAADGALGPRNLLLGMDAVLADGTAFKSGAKVVKSVAGFDVHKLFVGSRGRLLVATRLHLRLKPRPRDAVWFCVDGLARVDALARLRALRHEPLPPTALMLERAADGAFALRGRVAGRGVHVQDVVRRHELREGPAIDTAHVAHEDAAEVLAGNALPSALPSVLDALPDDAPFVWLGGGRFEAALADSSAGDAALRALPDARATGAVLRGAPERRGLGTPIDPGQQRLADGLKHALDPDDRLA